MNFALDPEQLTEEESKQLPAITDAVSARLED